MKVAILGKGYAVPDTLLPNDAPIFDWLRQHSPPGKDLFTGYVERRILGPGQTLPDIMVPAAARAILDAGVDPADIGVLSGYASVSEYITPNWLTVIHRDLGLTERCFLIPINDDFTNALSGLLVANLMVESGRARYGLVVTGCNWSRYSNYHKPQAISSADGAGAWLVGPPTDPSQFVFVDAMTTVKPHGYGAMYMQPEPLGEIGGEKAYSWPWYHIDAAGLDMFKQDGENEPPKLVKALLAKHCLTGSDITLFTHQASSVLLKIWNDRIKPNQFLNSLTQLANMTLASIPVNFAAEYDQISNDHVVMVGVGPGFQTTAVLLKRGG